MADSDGLVCSGYCALAISTPSGEVSSEIQTGVSDRPTNMVLFAEEALKLLHEVLAGGFQAAEGETVV